MKIDLMIVGAQKAGTTSLKNYLGEHPSICAHEQIEMSFFADENEFARGFNNAESHYFPTAHPGCQRRIAKNVTISIREQALSRLRDHNPDCKIVFIMREPVSRAYSAYTMAVRDGWMHNDFDDLADIVLNREYQHLMYYHFVQLGLYAEQLEMILKYFPAKNVRVYLFEDMREDSASICRDIFTWLNVDPAFVPNFSVRHNVTVKPKSKTMGKLIHGIRSPRNLVRRIAKRILPYSLFAKFRDLMLTVNNSKDAFQPMTAQIERVLENHFQSNNVLLGNLLKCPENRDCLRVFSKNHWMSPFFSSTAHARNS